MKIEQAELKFQPVVVTLETQEEVDQMYHILRHVEIEGTDSNSADWQLWSHLEGLVVTGYTADYDSEDEIIRLTKI